MAGEFQWFGFQIQHASELRRRWEADRLCGEESFLAVALEDGTCAGWVNWRPAGHHGNYEIGIALFPEYRDKGIGTEAQRPSISNIVVCRASPTSSISSDRKQT